MMKESEIGPKDLFNGYLYLAQEEDVVRFSSDRSGFVQTVCLDLCRVKANTCLGVELDTNDDVWLG